MRRFYALLIVAIVGVSAAVARTVVFDVSSPDFWDYDLSKEGSTIELDRHLKLEKEGVTITFNVADSKTFALKNEITKTSIMWCGSGSVTIATDGPSMPLVSIDATVMDNNSGTSTPLQTIQYWDNEKSFTIYLDGNEKGTWCYERFTVVVDEPAATINSIKEFKELSDFRKFKFNSTVSIIAQNGNTLYAQDNTGGICITGDITPYNYAFGDILPPGWSATKMTEHGAAQAINATNVPDWGARMDYNAVEITVPQIEDHLFEYVLIKDAMIDFRNNLLKTPNGSVSLNFVFDVDFNYPDNARYDAYGIPSYYDQPQFIPLAFEFTSYSGIDDITTPSSRVYKTIENGRVVIVKDNLRYNTMGQIIK